MFTGVGGCNPPECRGLTAVGCTHPTNARPASGTESRRTPIDDSGHRLSSTDPHERGRDDLGGNRRRPARAGGPREATECLRAPRCRAHPRPGPRCRSTKEGRRAIRAPGRRPGRHQGCPLRAGRAHDLRQPDAPELPTAVRCHGDRPAPGRRRDPDRQDQHGRVCDGLLDGEQRVRTHAQSLGRVACARRFLGWLGGCCRGRTGPALPGNRHRRLDSTARRLLRRRRPQTDLWTGQPIRPDRLRQLARPDRSVRPRPGRYRAAPEGHRRPRPQRLDKRGSTGPRLSGDPRRVS